MTDRSNTSCDVTWARAAWLNGATSPNPTVVIVTADEYSASILVAMPSKWSVPFTLPRDERPQDQPAGADHEGGEGEAEQRSANRAVMVEPTA